MILPCNSTHAIP